MQPPQKKDTLQEISAAQPIKISPNHSEKLFPELVQVLSGGEGTGKRVTFENCIAFIEKNGKKIYGENFKIYESDHDLIFKLLVYFINDENNAAKLNLYLDKGILLSGPIGCGKTSLMFLMRLFQLSSARFIIKSCREISMEFIKDGYGVIEKYSLRSFNKEAGDRIPRVYCLDDLGIENNLKYYGNECNVMGEIILSRYDMYMSSDMLTHITTNLNSSEIENIYGNRVRSRMRQMFNLVAFDKDSKDKRV